MSVTTKIEMISPAIAQSYLAQNSKLNRKPKTSRIGIYAREMAAGQWQMTGEAIKFSDSGVLIDGQNRLFAIIQAQVSVEMLVVRGVPDDAMPVLDSGVTRTAADALTISGIVQSNEARHVSTTVRNHLSFVRGEVPHAGVKDGGRTAHTRQELQDHLANHPGLIQVTHDVRNIYNVMRLPLGALATAKYVFDGIDANASKEFFETILSGATNGVGDPFYTLGRRVASDKNTGSGRISLATALFYLFRTWNAVRAGEALQKFQIGTAATGWKNLPTPR